MFFLLLLLCLSCCYIKLLDSDTGLWTAPHLSQQLTIQCYKFKDRILHNWDPPLTQSFRQTPPMCNSHTTVSKSEVMSEVWIPLCPISALTHHSRHNNTTWRPMDNNEIWGNKLKAVWGIKNNLIAIWRESLSPLGRRERERETWFRSICLWWF